MFVPHGRLQSPASTCARPLVHGLLNRATMQLDRSIPLLCCLLLTSALVACESDPDADEAADETGDGDGDPSGDGDGDSTGDGDGDPTGDGDGEGEGDGDGDGEPADDCPDEFFPAVSPDPANAEFPDPYLNVYCEGDEVIVESNGIPGYEFVEVTPNPLDDQDWEWHFPRNPEVAAQTSEIPLLNGIGIAINGLPIFGPNEGMFPDPYGDPVYNGIMDFCMGHTAQMGVYHYHALLVECLTAATPDGEPDPVIGYSFDGFPIFGPMGCLDAECTEVVEFESGWVQTGDPSTYAWDNYEYQGGDEPTILDQCNGHVGPAGDYHYHATATFPYVLGCYTGTATNNGGMGMP